MRKFQLKEVATFQRNSKSKKSSDDVNISSYCFATLPPPEKSGDSSTDVKKIDPVNRSYLFVGLTNGKIYFYKKKHQDHKTLLQAGKVEHEAVQLDKD
jgi:hypothetical protein